MCFGPLKKICNWGPLTALGIIKIVTFTTIHCGKQQWGSQYIIIANDTFYLFLILSGLSLYHFINSIYEGPGYLPFNWVPENEVDCQYLQFCNICQGYKAPRSHHCRSCNRCILKMDHHCPWINSCVGHRNHGYFTAFLASSVAGCCFSTYIMICWLATVFSTRPLPFSIPSLFTMVMVLLSIGLSIGVIIAVGMLLYFQITSIVKNQTGIESWIIEKANFRRSDTSIKFMHPYSISIKFNVKQVLSWHCAPIGDGINWPVIEGCDQYTLTREQLIQKQEKRKRAKRYRVVSKATGSWVPISYGFKVLCSPPITDESRIKLDVGDTVIVTRWRKHWLFGEKELKFFDDSNKNDRIRGWFPRPCVIEVIEKDAESEGTLKIKHETDIENFEVPDSYSSYKKTNFKTNGRKKKQ